jgi:hypothetical protein
MDLMAAAQRLPATAACAVGGDGVLRAAITLPTAAAAATTLTALRGTSGLMLLIPPMRLTCGNVIVLRAGATRVVLDSTNTPALRCAPPPPPPTPPAPPPSPAPAPPPSPPSPPRPPRPPPSPPAPPPANRDTQNITWTFSTATPVRNTSLPSLEHRLAAAYSLIKPVQCSVIEPRRVRAVAQQRVQCRVSYDTPQQARAVVGRVKGASSAVLERASELLRQDCSGDVSVRAVIEQQVRVVGKFTAGNMNKDLSCRGGPQHWR